MQKNELARLIKTIAIGARAAIAREEHARAEWNRSCDALPKRKPKRADSLAKYDAAHALNSQALVNLQAAIAYKDTFREPFCQLLPMFDKVSTLADRIELLGISSDNHCVLSESSGCIGIVHAELELSPVQGGKGECGVIFAVLSFDLGNVEGDNVALRDALLKHGGRIGGVTSWGMLNGSLARSWAPFAQDECSV